MADKTPTPEEAITGPAVPAGFSGIRPWVMLYRPLIGLLLVGGGVFFFTHPLTVHGTAAPGSLSGKVSAVDAGGIVAKPHATLMPAPTPHPVAQSDVGAGPATAPSLAPVAVATPLPVPAPGSGALPPAALPVPATPSTESPAQAAARARDAADRAALGAPLPAPAPVASNAARQKDATAYDSAPPDGTFLEPGHIAPVTLYTSVDSTVNGGPALLIGYFGGDVLDYYQRYVLIPRNSRALGHLAESSLQPGQDRVGAMWSSILLPNGHTISLTDSPGVDLTGTVGFSGKIDNHERGALGRVVAFSILAAGAQLAQPQNGSNCGGNTGCSPSVGQSIAQGLGTQIQTLATTQYNRASQTPPSLHVIEGAQVGLEITNFLPIRPYGSQQ